MVCRWAIHNWTDTDRKPIEKVRYGAAYFACTGMSTGWTCKTVSTFLLSRRHPNRWGRRALKWEKSSMAVVRPAFPSLAMGTRSGQHNPSSFRFSFHTGQNFRFSGTAKRNQWHCSMEVELSSRLARECFPYRINYVGTREVDQGVRRRQRSKEVRDWVIGYLLVQLCSLVASQLEGSTTKWPGLQVMQIASLPSVCRLYIFHPSIVSYFVFMDVSRRYSNTLTY